MKRMMMKYFSALERVVDWDYMPNKVPTSFQFNPIQFNSMQSFIFILINSIYFRAVS